MGWTKICWRWQTRLTDHKLNTTFCFSLAWSVTAWYCSRVLQSLFLSLSPCSVWFEKEKRLIAGWRDGEQSENRPRVVALFNWEAPVSRASMEHGETWHRTAALLRSSLWNVLTVYQFTFILILQTNRPPGYLNIPVHLWFRSTETVSDVCFLKFASRNLCSHEFSCLLNVLLFRIIEQKII